VGLPAVLARSFDALLDIVAPRECAGCGVPSRSGFCPRCHDAIERVGSRALDTVPIAAAGTYTAPLDAVVRRFKYQARPDLAAPLAHLILPELGRLELGAEQLWVPVPLHARRLAERGYDQACLLAMTLARATGGTWAPRALIRALPTAQQASLSRDRRESNVAAAFAVRDARIVRGRSVVLVDDVVTTGATARACIAALSAVGARVAGVACVAVTARESPTSQPSTLRD
jgi:ComF family protein